MERLGFLAECETLTAGDATIYADATLFERETLSGRLDLPLDTSNCALILAAYRRWGRDCAAQLNGDYRFVIEDHAAGSVLAAVDHMAVRPLFYAETGTGLVFSSTVRALVDHLGGAPKINEQRVANLLVDFISWSASETLCEGIHKVPFAHTMEWRDGKTTARRHWQPATIAPLTLSSTSAYVERGREVFRAAIRDRALIDAPLGAHLSGGLDSSAIAVLSNTMRREAGLSDTVGFAWQPWDKADPPDTEGGWIAAVQARSGMDVIAAVPKTDDALELLRLDLVADYNVGNLFNETAVQRAAQSRGIGLILSGLGGDEALTFNGRYMASHLARRGQLLSLARLHPSGGIRGLAAGVVQAGREMLDNRQMAVEASKMRKTLASEALLSRVEIEPSWRAHAGTPRGHQIDRLTQGYLSERIEVLAQSGERHGLRYSFPMLDKRVLEFALSVPVELFWQRNVRRWLFREMMQGVLPDNVRMNHVKFEPVRAGAIMDVVTPALRQAGHIIEQKNDFERAHLIDLDRLTMRLRDHKEGQGFAHLRLAVQLLDW